MIVAAPARLLRRFALIAGAAIVIGGGACRELADRAPPVEVEVEDAQPPISPEHTITLIVTGQNTGMFEPCGCPGGMLGGLGGRATVISRLREDYPNVVQIDTGDQVPAFSLKEQYGYRREIRDLTDRAIVDGMQYLAYDAVLLADLDLEWGLERVAELQAELPLVAANLYTKDGEPLAAPYRIVDTRPARVAIVGLVDAEALALLEPAVRERLRIAEPIATASALAAELEGKADLTVAVTVGGPSFDTRLARAVDGIDVIVSQPGHQRHAVFKADDRAVWVQSPRAGLDVGVLQVNLDDEKGIAATHYHEVPIDRNTPRERHFAEVFSALNFHTARLTLAGEQNDSPLSLVGADQCRDCHQVQYEFWSEHEHADSLRPLLETGREEDPLCLPCHVTGYGMDGGFADMLATPQFANVGCVMCHHVDLAAHAVPNPPPVREVSLDVCKMCHTREDSPRFMDDPKAYLEAASCPPDPAGSSHPAKPM